MFPEIGWVKLFYNSPARIVERLSEYIFLISKNNKQTNKQTKQESKKAKETKEEKRISPENKFAATRVKIFLVTRISGNVFWPQVI